MTGRSPARFVIPRPPADSPALARLRRLAIGLVATAMIAAGGWKLWRPADGPTMLSRAFPAPQAQRAVAFMEIALGLWLLSGKSPRLAPGIVAAGLVATGCLMAGEFRRERPLPCGCFPARPVTAETNAVRRDLGVSIGRNAFLVVLCGLAAVAAPAESRDESDDD